MRPLTAAFLFGAPFFFIEFMTAQNSNNSEFVAALKASVPVFMGYIPLGMVFGFLFVQAGGTPLMAIVASFIVYGGASQYMMVPMLASGVSVAGIALATFVINFRHVFYGISLLHRLPATGWYKWYIAFTLTDETYSILCTMKENTPLSRMLWVAFFNHMWWIVGSFVGALIGAQAKIELAGLDFVLTSLFAMLTCEQWRSRKTAWPLWAALIGYGAARFAFPEQALSVSIGFCVAAGLVWGAKFRKSDTLQEVSVSDK